MNALSAIVALTAVSCAQVPQDTTLIVADDPEMGALARELLPEVSRRAGMELTRPVRIAVRR